ncbi:MAG: hypothetical protein CR974_00520 [Gammaproteobacteria bacterium]|nr:MAG: hypothetical protein CR974_00520 [Gammaproteobacteria bacterium]
MTNYFDARDSKQRKKCLSKPVLVVNASGQKITNRYRSSGTAYRTQHTQAKFEPAVASRRTKRCSGSGGTVKVNGRVFHLDPKLLCAKYNTSGTGSISSGYVARHRKLPRVNANFRRKISPFVTKTARKYGMDPAFIHAIISAESAYNPNARSHVGAMGLMQLMPFTAKRFGVRNAYNPHQNIEAGTRYLKLLYKEFGSLELAAAGYNAGEGAVRKYNRNIPPYKETRKYVPKVMAFYRKYKQNRSLIAIK